MNDLLDVVDVEDRLHPTYRAIAERTVVSDQVLWADTTVHLASTVESRDGRRRRSARLAIAAAVVLVVGIAAVVALRESGVSDDLDLGPASEGDREPFLPGSPIDPRYGHSAVWTGREMLIFGGVNVTNGDPATVDDSDADENLDAGAYDPVARSWRPIAAPPDELGWSTLAVWTGNEVIALETMPDDLDHPEDAPVGAVYDPADDSWSTIDAPGLGYLGLDADLFWTGDRVLVAGLSQSDGFTTADQIGVATYDPATGTWQPLPDAPTVLSPAGDTVWTGQELIYVGPAVAPGADLDTETPPGVPFGLPATEMTAVALDPVSGQWRTLPAPPLSLRTSAAVAWTGTEAIVAGGDPAAETAADGGLVDGAAFDPATGTWAPLPDAPAALYAKPQIVGDVIVGMWTDDPQRRVVLFDTTTRTWSRGTADPFPPEEGFTDEGFKSAVSTGTQVLAFGGTEPGTTKSLGEGFAVSVPLD